MTDELYEATKKEVMSEHDEYKNADVPIEIWIERNKYFCLLYTSPSPRDRTRSRMPSSA